MHFFLPDVQLYFITEIDQIFFGKKGSRKSRLKMQKLNFKSQFSTFEIEFFRYFSEKSLIFL